MHAIVLICTSSTSTFDWPALSPLAFNLRHAQTLRALWISAVSVSSLATQDEEGTVRSHLH